MDQTYIKVYLTPADKKTIQAAAREARMSDSQFMLIVALDKSKGHTITIRPEYTKEQIDQWYANDKQMDRINGEANDGR